MKKIMFFIAIALIQSSCTNSYDKKCEVYSAIIIDLVPKIVQYLDTVQMINTSIKCRKGTLDYTRGQPIYIPDSLAQQFIQPFLKDEEVDFVKVSYTNQKKRFRIFNSLNKFCENSYEFKGDTITVSGYFKDIIYYKNTYKSQQRSKISFSRSWDTWHYIEIEVYFKPTSLTDT